MAAAVRTLAASKAEINAANARGDAGKSYWSDIGKSIAKGNKTASEKALDDLGSYFKKAQDNESELNKMKSQQKPAA
jgi:hypothetical protein